MSSSTLPYIVYHKAEPWTGLRPSTDKIIVHIRDRFSTAKEMDTHFRKRGFFCCGYHYVVTGSGVHVMRHPDSIGAVTDLYDRDTLYVCILTSESKAAQLPAPLRAHLSELLDDLQKNHHPNAELLSGPAILKLKGYEALTTFIEERNKIGRSGRG